MLDNDNTITIKEITENPEFFDKLAFLDLFAGIM